MRGLAISFLTLACVASRISFAVLLRGMKYTVTLVTSEYSPVPHNQENLCQQVRPSLSRFLKGFSARRLS